MKNENFFTVQGWMVNELHLSGNRLMLYALIYGFSQDGKSRFKGASQYLADCLGITKKTALETLEKLVKKNYIKKHKSGSKGHEMCDYGVNSERIKKFSGNKITPQNSLRSQIYTASGNKITPQNSLRSQIYTASGNEITPHINIHKDIYNNITSAKAEDQKELIPIIQETTKVEPVSPSSAKKRNKELTEEQKPLFHAAKLCFEADGRTKAIMYQDKGSAQMHMENLKLLVIRCQNIAPGITADFMRNVLEHFKVLADGRLKGKVTFTPRALITPWVWETVIDSLPAADDELTKKIRQNIRGMFQ